MHNSINYTRIEKAIRYLTENFKKQPSLEEVAEHIHVSPFHFQRMFSDWAGISPKKFLQYLTIEELKKELQQTNSLISAADKVGLSAQSRVYDLFVNIESVTPNEFKTKGKGIEIEYGFHDSPFGECFIANTERGICSMSFSHQEREKTISELESHWENASIKKNQTSTEQFSKQIFSPENSDHKFNLLVKGTNFQLKVWKALLKIPFGGVSTYAHIAGRIGNNKAMRAVGSAVGANPVAFLIPCHRVIRSEGLIGNYHWGSARKSAIIGWEMAKNSEAEESME
ncbi:MAG: methylated-DNA--[protein]-cysteine S-methyltransferase [Bacteroidia bacterium]|nr:methylated-DNA--[protein]-cysteine S-methyltransferase [Bacteroidia bacterium]